MRLSDFTPPPTHCSKSELFMIPMQNTKLLPRLESGVRRDRLKLRVDSNRFKQIQTASPEARVCARPGPHGIFK